MQEQIVRVAVCGVLPGAVELLEGRDDVGYLTFSNGNELYDYLENATPFDFIVIQCEAGEGLVPLSYFCGRHESVVYLTADPQDAEGRKSLDEQIDIVLDDKRRNMARSRRSFGYSVSN